MPLQGPVVLGHAYDATGSYTSLLVLLAVALGLGAALNLLLPRYSGPPATDLSQAIQSESSGADD